MRSLETLMMASLIGLVGVAVWQGHRWFPGLLPSAASSVVSPIHVPLPKDAKGSHSRLARASSSRFAIQDSRSGNAALLGAGQFASGATEVVVLLPGSPNSKTLAVGTTRSQLRERYGVPTLDVASSRDGSLIERYYYVDPDNAHMTVATLQNGRLVSAQTVQR